MRRDEIGTVTNQGSRLRGCRLPFRREHAGRTGFCNEGMYPTYLSSHISESPVECLMRASPVEGPLASRDLAEAGLQRMSASCAWTWRWWSSPDVGLAPRFRFLLDMGADSTTWKRNTFGGVWVENGVYYVRLRIITVNRITGLPRETLPPPSTDPL